jgi:DNA-binding FadR family transcriptional regulator
MSSISSISSTKPAYQNYNASNVQQTIQDFQAIGNALQSGDVSSAQSALTTFQQALATNTNSQSTTSQPFGKNSQANTDYQSLVSALQSGNLTNAQQAYTSLQKDLKPVHKGHHHHHGSSATSASTATTSTTSSTTSSNTASSPTSATGGTGSLLNVSA